MRHRALWALAPALLLAACDLAPAYHPPVAAVPAKFKEAGDWRPAAPRDDYGSWWRGFGDPTLDALEPQVEAANQDLAAARAAYLQARDYVAEAQSALYPHIGNIVPDAAPNVDLIGGFTLNGIGAVIIRLARTA